MAAMKTPKRYSSSSFYDRQWEQRHLQSLLRQDANILITAPRRVGKTELSFKLLDWALDEGWLASYANVQDALSEADFFQELIRALDEAGIHPKAFAQFKNAWTVLRSNLPSKAKVSDGETSVEFELTPAAEDALRSVQDRLGQLLESVTASEQTILIALDELPIFLTTLSDQPGGEARVKAMLNWFRKLRTLPALRRVRWLLSGSIGLDTFVEDRLLTGSINDLRPENLGPFEEAIAIEFVKRRALLGTEPLEISDDLARAVVGRVGLALPFYLRLMVDELQSLAPPRRSSNFPALADVETAYAGLVSTTKTMHFMHWVSRLDLQFGKVAALSVRAILKQCCQKSEGSTRARLRNLMIKRHPQHDSESIDRELVRVLGILERDGYIHGDGARWVFRSFLLRDFWVRHVP
jgi:hypothetical protein